MMDSGGGQDEGLISWLLGVLASLVTFAVGWISTATVGNSRQLARHGQRLKDHEKRIEATEEHGELLASIRQDVAYIRGQISRRDI